MSYYTRPYNHRMMRGRLAGQNEAYTLRVDVREEDDNFVLTTAVPGLSADDLNIQILENVIRIEGEYQTSDGEHLLRELPEGKFIRTLRLPSEVDPDKVEAKIKNGILSLSLPKVESARPKQIKVLAK
ncbi:MAG: Hsp20/alpha crystallin family protein [Anaerolineales bacterium]|uniref:Hsp20/alpha crystallin family protein n=1 Tax=Candidatus Desulfolinea nitratireducens TaxID=2841698 RepID=A0A8J6TIE0_9CHLR|nr:Hsp20/alpha crystallin family protein [Candidatus Desulfolinea nitratireducens]MBL6960305.1 Hsp20/alpha crystallin family protein [Anaerolineales bacterium]